MERGAGNVFPARPEEYELCEEIGEGVSATVYRARCVPLEKIVAIKVLDLEKCNNDLGGIVREVQIMSLIDHPNVLRALCSFAAGQKLWVVTPYMAGGSAQNVIKFAYPEGFEEPVIATLLYEVLKALAYLHSRGHIHRDVKAGNILIDTTGAVKLGDFGVSACMFDSGDRQRLRNTFAGTPCWMAPEVMQRTQGYDLKADIWSFGITALELAHGHAPFSKYPPLKVLLMTLQNAPPGLDYERDRKFSKSFKDMISLCLDKNPKKRPAAEVLLKHPFFKQARSSDYLAETILHALPPLGERFRRQKAKDADLFLLNKVSSENQEELSKKEYIRGISAWDFDLDELKRQASLTKWSEESIVSSESEGNLEGKSPVCGDPSASPEGLPSAYMLSPSSSPAQHTDSFKAEKNAHPIFSVQPMSFYMSPAGPPSQMEAQSAVNSDLNAGRPHNSDEGSSRLAERPQPSQSSCSLTVSDMKDPQTPPSPVVKQVGRFKIVAADVGSQAALSGPSSAAAATSSRSAVSGAALLPSLQFLLELNGKQREHLSKLVTQVEQISGVQPGINDTGGSDGSQLLHSNARREKELKAYIAHLQQSMANLVQEIENLKRRNAQLEQIIRNPAVEETSEEEDGE